MKSVAARGGLCSAAVPHSMPKRRTPCCSLRLFFMALVVLVLISLGLLRNAFFYVEQNPAVYHVDPKYRELAHAYSRNILARECRPSFARQEIRARLRTSSSVTGPFLWRDVHLPDTVFQYPPPFGFLDLHGKLMEVLSLLPSGPSQQHQRSADVCRKCVVVGNGGILRGLELGSLIDEFDIVIRLNSGPLQNFSKDVGNHTSIRMSYPEGSPKVWEDHEPTLLFVAVIYKSVDFHWLKAMITRQKVSLWDWLFFWQKVPDEIPIKPSQFQVLNPEIIREVAMDMLQYSTPKFRFWGWDQNVPTLGISALNLATYLCDEVSLAGFGYNMSQKEAPLHYYDSLPMTAMLAEEMHNVDRERAFLQRLVADGTISDLTGGLHCSFCTS
ncbi:lactosylceramide alpha-2,3-sialyltransferase [Denticeps clupeoides]|uniref:Lactosylceramide alpha-2,3-sialyltransferase n=1 Tax=Denticeps clupeoides TaxID=299321 RepID=A0AAY4DDF1_9TELE|nr:lactosylceramide alpha-2,3-sialyltransferase [Denticeps clupeoides]